MVAPADGLVSLVDTAVPPAELDLATEPDAARQHLPVGAGRARAARPGRRRGDRRQHRPGKFHSADLAEASADNERNSMWIRTPEGVTSSSCRSPG